MGWDDSTCFQSGITCFRNITEARQIISLLLRKRQLRNDNSWNQVIFNRKVNRSHLIHIISHQFWGKKRIKTSLNDFCDYFLNCGGSHDWHFLCFSFHSFFICLLSPLCVSLVWSVLVFLIISFSVCLVRVHFVLHRTAPVSWWLFDLPKNSELKLVLIWVSGSARDANVPWSRRRLKRWMWLLSTRPWIRH